MPRRSDGPPAAKRGCVAVTTDLSDRHIRLCAQDAIMAVQKRVLGCVTLKPRPSTQPHMFATTRFDIGHCCSQARNDRSVDGAAYDVSGVDSVAAGLIQ